MIPTSNMFWNNVTMFFPGDQIPSKLPDNRLYLYVSANYLGDFHNRYFAVLNLLRTAEDRLPTPSSHHAFQWVHTPDRKLDELLDRKINVLRHTPHLGPMLVGNRIKGTLLMPSELWVFGEILRQVRVALAGEWKTFLYGDMPDQDSSRLVQVVAFTAERVIHEARRLRWLRFHEGSVKTFDKIYSVSVQIGHENFMLTVDSVEPSVYINVTPSLMELLVNVLGEESIGIGDIIVDTERVLEFGRDPKKPLQPPMTWPVQIDVIPRSRTIKYEFKVLE